MANSLRTVDIAADAIRDRILRGSYPVGERLPAERKLAEQLGISRLTLRAAIARLQSEGLLQPRQGDGVWVLDYRRDAGVELLPHLLQQGELRLLSPFLQLRRALAAEAVAAASIQASDADLDELQVLADRLATADLEALRHGNLVFSRRVIELADNLPMLLLFNTVTRVYQSRPEIAAAMLVHPDGIRASFGAIVSLLRQRRPNLARDTVRQILETLDEATVRSLEDR